MRLFVFLFLLNFTKCFYIHSVDVSIANTISYKYMKSQSYLNNENPAVKVSEQGYQDIMKSVISTSDIAINKISHDEFYVLYNCEDLLQEYGLCTHEIINNTCYLKNIIINPYYYHKYSYLFQSFVKLIAYNNRNIILNIDYLPYHLQLEYTINYDDRKP